MKYLLSCFGLHNPFINLELPEHAVYPVTLKSKSGYDLDYTSLLIGERYLIDKAAYEYVTEGRRAFLSPMALSLVQLKGAGLLEFVDVAAIVQQNRSELVEKTKLIASDIEGWLPLLREQWLELKAGRPAFQQSFGSPEKLDLNTQHFTVLNAAYSRSGSLLPADITHFATLLESKKTRFSTRERDDAQLIIEPLIAHLLIHELLREKLAAVILDWDDSSAYYRKLYTSRWDNPTEEVRIARTARRILTLSMPSLKADNVDAVIRFMQDKKAVTSLRKEVIRFLNSGGEIDQRWWSEYTLEIINASLQRDKTMRKVRFGGALAGLFVPGGSILADVVAEGAISLVEEKIESGLSRPDHYWFFAMQKVGVPG